MEKFCARVYPIAQDNQTVEPVIYDESLDLPFLNKHKLDVKTIGTQ